MGLFYCTVHLAFSLVQNRMRTANRTHNDSIQIIFYTWVDRILKFLISQLSENVSTHTCQAPFGLQDSVSETKLVSDHKLRIKSVFHLKNNN